MAKLAKEDMETFKIKQTELIQRFDPKILKQNRALPPIENSNGTALTARGSSSNSFSLPPLTNRNPNKLQWNGLELKPIEEHESID